MIKKNDKKKSKPPKKAIWKSFTATDYQQAAKEMVHFSAKTVNSNTLPFGIRLDSAMSLNLPYIAASTIDRSHVPMDYTKNIGKPSTMVKQINAVRHKKLEQFQGVPQTDVEAILACETILDSSYLPKESIGIRLRQIILQDSDGNDVAATPLPCGGLSVLINARIEEEYNTENPIDSDGKDGKRKNMKRFIKRKRAYLGIGGANPQNVGLNVRAMQKPLMFIIPSMKGQSRVMRQLFAIYYKGIPITPNKEILREFIIWQEELLIQHFKAKPSNVDTSIKEAEFLTAITQNFIKNVKNIEKLLTDNIKKLPDEKKCWPTLSFIQQALLDRSLRTKEWRHELAREID